MSALRALALGCLGLFLVFLPGCAELDPAWVESVLDASTPDEGLDEPTVTRGLREALRIGAGRAIERTSRVDGFLANELIRIYLPEDLERMAETLRRVGFARQVDELEVGMNRAAERAAGEAREIFSGAIAELSIRDAFGILRGGDTAATVYLRDRTEGELRARFQPIIADKMREIDLYEAYNRLADVYNSLPLGQEPAVDLGTHLTDEAMDGLFEILATEERRIREDPLARTTELLRRVFGRPS